ncbi:TPA: GDP-mannose 4,6-dehydratase, partial [bacterium]|nr:GDP-mannose 4,6-dehydratase [bacterium]
PRSIENPVRTHVSIVDSTLAILEELRVRGGRMVMASSSSIYGNSPVLPKSEEMRPAP